MHEVSDKGRAFFPKNILFSITMDANESLHEHLVENKDIRKQLHAIGWKMEGDMVVITLKSLLVAIEHFIETLDITAADKDLKFR